MHPLRRVRRALPPGSQSHHRHRLALALLFKVKQLLALLYRRPRPLWPTTRAGNVYNDWSCTADHSAGGPYCLQVSAQRTGAVLHGILRETAGPLRATGLRSHAQRATAARAAGEGGGNGDLVAIGTGRFYSAADSARVGPWGVVVDYSRPRAARLCNCGPVSGSA